jgi:hypothetical protein
MAARKKVRVRLCGAGISASLAAPTMGGGGEPVNNNSGHFIYPLTRRKNFALIGWRRRAIDS